MEILGTSVGEWFAILFVGLGPIRISLAYIPVSRSLSDDVKVALAVRTVLVGAVLSAVVLVLGGTVARTFALEDGFLIVAAGLAFLSKALGMLSASPTDVPEVPKITDPMRLAISPLAVPAMISPVGVVALFIVAMGSPPLGEALVFVALVAAILALDLGAMLLSRHVARYATVSILELVQQVFGILILALSVRLVLEGLEDLGLFTLAGV